MQCGLFVQFPFSLHKTFNMRTSCLFLFGATRFLCQNQDTPNVARLFSVLNCSCGNTQAGRDLKWKSPNFGFDLRSIEDLVLCLIIAWVVALQRFLRIYISLRLKDLVYCECI